jgi:hypothetical protein
MLDYLFANWSSTEVGWRNRTTTQNTEVNQQQNSFKYTWSENTPGVAQSESWPQPYLTCCDMTSRAGNLIYFTFYLTRQVS